MESEKCMYHTCLFKDSDNIAAAQSGAARDGRRFAQSGEVQAKGQGRKGRW